MLTAKLLLVYLLQTANTLGINIDISSIDPTEAYCLAENIYHEARSEDIQGQYAVASVTLNRVNDGRFPNTVCGVVRQTATSKITNTVVCAFSWYCENNKKGKEIPIQNKDGSINQRVVDQFRVASLIAIAALGGSVEDATKGATHFHNPAVTQPAWKYDMKKTVRLGNHDFYKMPPIR